MARWFLLHIGTYYNCNEGLEAEIHAIMMDMTLAVHHSEGPILMRSDSAVARSIICNNSLDRVAYGQLV